MAPTNNTVAMWDHDKTSTATPQYTTETESQTLPTHQANYAHTATNKVTYTTNAEHRIAIL